MAASCRRSLIRSCFVELVATWSCRSLLAGVRLSESRGSAIRLSPVESVLGWVVSDRASPRDFVGTVSKSVSRDFSSYRVMRHTCRARS